MITKPYRLFTVISLIFTFVLISHINAWADEIPAWVSAKMRSPNKNDRLMAIEQLTGNMDERASLLLLDCSGDEDNKVRAEAFWALTYRMPYLKGSGGSDKITQRLLEATKDNLPEIRKYALRGLIFAEEKMAAPVLMELMNDDDLAVRQQAFVSMRILTGVYIENNRFYWKQWYENKANPKFFNHLEWAAPELQNSLKKQRVLELIGNRDNWVSKPMSPIITLELSQIGKTAYKELANFALNNDWVNPELFDILKKIDNDQTVYLLKDGLRQGKRVQVCAKWLGCEDQESYELLLTNYGKGNRLVDYQVIIEVSNYKDVNKVLNLWDRVINDAELPSVSVAVRQAGLRYAKFKDERGRIKPFIQKALFHKNPRFQETAINAVRDNKLTDFKPDLNELFKADTIEVSRLARQVADELKF